MFVNCEVENVNVVKWLDIPFLLFGNVDDLMRWVDSITLSPVRRNVLKVVIMTTIWVIWHKNSEVFQTHAMRKSHIFENIVIHSYDWVENRCSKSNTT